VSAGASGLPGAAHQHQGRVPLTGLWCLVALVSACSSPRLAERTGPLASAAVTPDNSPQPPPQIMPPPLGDQQLPQSPGNQPPPQPPSDQQSAAAAAVPTGEPAQPKRKPKPKYRRKSREEPKQLLPQSSDTTSMPPGAVINTQVGEIGSAVMSILGKKVQGPKGEDLGRVVDVLADATGRVRVAIIDFGGFLGVGTRRIAVDWPLLRFDPAGDKPLILSLSREKLQSAPEYKDSGHPRVLMPTAVSPSVPADTIETKK
jgi:hypothetical protein